MAGREDDEENLRDQVQDLLQLVLGYAKQETLEPIKGLARFLGFGLAAALLGGLGLILLLLGGLRLLQTETGSVFQGRRTWIPYLLIVVVSATIAGGALRARRSREGERSDPSG